MNKKLLALSCLLLSTLGTAEAYNFEKWINNKIRYKSTQQLNSQLLMAAICGNLPAMKKLIAKGANVNSQQFTTDVTYWQECGFHGDWAKKTVTKQTILMKLAQLGQVKPKVITLLITAGANRTLTDSDGNTEQTYLNERLLHAALDGDIIAMKNLIARGADINSQQFYSEIHRPIGTFRLADQQSILMKLRIANQDKVPAEVINTLIDAGADVTLKDSEGRTADDNNTTISDLYSLMLSKIHQDKTQAELDESLWHEILHKHPKTVLYLISLGANPKSINIQSLGKEYLVWLNSLLASNKLL